MKFVRPSYEILTKITGNELKEIEKISRVCYKSENLITEDGESAKKLVGSLISRGHEAMLEHSMLSVKFIVDRATSHELVRHRMASFAQESQRYCNYSKDKFNDEIVFIEPWWLRNMESVKTERTEYYELQYTTKTPPGTVEFIDSLLKSEDTYFKLLDAGYNPQDARAVLPNCTKTEVIVTANYREWRHILKLRTSKDAAPEMRRIMRPLLTDLVSKIPIIFDDIYDKEI